MATLLLGATLIGSSYLILSKKDEERQLQKKQEAANATAENVIDVPLYSGTFGNAEQLQNVLHNKHLFTEIRKDVDLTGIPHYWIKMKNGGQFKVYNLDLINYN